MTHTCPDCGQACTCDMEDMEQDAPDDCCHNCDDCDDDDCVGCENCGKNVHIEAAVSEDDCYFCAECHAEWRAIFDACEHKWTPHEGENGPGKYCTECHGFVETDEPDVKAAP